MTVLVNQTIGADLLELARKFGEKLVNSTQTPDSFTARHPGQSYWQSPENLDTGMSGDILFLLTLYNRTGEERYLAAADQGTAHVLEHCRRHPTNNYALYTGRGGFIYVLLQRYRISGQSHVLDACLELIRPADEEFLQSEYTSDFLYDGRAGTLLLLARLYQVTREKYLAEYIQVFITEIIRHASLSNQGLFWNAEEEFHTSPLRGFGRGLAGIRYVFSQLNATTDLFTSLIAAIDQYDHGEHTYSWAESAIDLLSPALDKAGIDRNAVHTGLRGSLEDLVEALEGYLPSLNHPNLDGGLLQGDMGIAYLLLLKMADKDDIPENILHPLPENIWDRKQAAIPYTLTRNSIRKMWLLKHYPTTLTIIERNSPNLLPLYWQQAPVLKVTQETQAFFDFIGTQGRHLMPILLYERLKDLLILEKAKVDFLQEETRSPLQIRQDTILYQDKVVAWLNEPDEWLMKQIFRVSDNVRFINTNWDWAFIMDRGNLSDQRFKDRLSQLIKEAPSDHPWLLQIFGKFETVDSTINAIPNLLLQCFREPKTLGAAIEEIKLIFTSLPEKARELLPKEFNHKEHPDVRALIDDLDWVILKHFRPLLYRNALERIV
jgi:hypothetical protein